MFLKSSHHGLPTRFPCFSASLFAAAFLSIQFHLPIQTVSASVPQAAKESHSKNYLYDRFYFTNNGEALQTGSDGTIYGIAGSILERQTTDKYNLIYGIFTISTGNKALTLSAGPLTLTLPPFSSVSLRLTDDCAITTHHLSTPVDVLGKTDAGTVNTSISDKITLPGGAIPVQALKLESKKAPIFFIGNAEFNQIPLAKESQTTHDTISVSSGQIFLNPKRDLQVITPAGVVTAQGNTRFFLYLTQGAGTARVLNCSSNELQLHAGKKFRRVRPSEEFCIFDHRPTQQEVLPADGLGRKEVVMHEVEGQKTAATNTFLIVSLLASPYFLGDWKPASSLDKKILAAMLKSAAAFDSVHASSEDFYIAPNNFYPNSLYKEMR